jgi:hypothetical protein
MDTDNQHAERAEAPAHQVTIMVNTKSVHIAGPRVTGAEIKQAAMAQGVPIQADFVLSELRQNGRTKIVGDTDVVTVTPKSAFVAVAPDDNS